MKFLVDESADARIADYLRPLDNDVTIVAQDYLASLKDRDVLTVAHREQRILITNDRDFGELVFRHRQPHAGVIYFRLSSTELSDIIPCLNEVLTEHAHELDQFIVVTEKRIRVRRSS